MLHATTICALAKGPTIGPLATRRNSDWLLYFAFFFATPTVPHLHIQTWWTSPTGTKSQGHMAQTTAGACFHPSHCWPEQSSDHLPTGMLMRCTCTVPWTTSSTSKTSVIKRKDPPPRNLPFEFHIMHLATTRNVQKDWLSTDIHQLRPFRSSTSITGHTCVRSRERGCKADMLAWFASS